MSTARFERIWKLHCLNFYGSRIFFYSTSKEENKKKKEEGSWEIFLLHSFYFHKILNNSIKQHISPRTEQNRGKKEKKERKKERKNQKKRNQPLSHQLLFLFGSDWCSILELIADCRVVDFSIRMKGLNCGMAFWMVDLRVCFAMKWELIWLSRGSLMKLVGSFGWVRELLLRFRRRSLVVGLGVNIHWFNSYILDAFYTSFDTTAVALSNDTLFVT